MNKENVGNNEKSTYQLGGCTGKGFMPGQSGNPSGRPKTPLKDFQRSVFAKMSDEDKLNFLKSIPPEIRWKMAEGNPDQANDLTTDGEKLPQNNLDIELLADEMAKKLKEKKL